MSGMSRWMSSGPNLLSPIPEGHQWSTVWWGEQGRVLCECGWEGPWRLTDAGVSQDIEWHLNTARWGQL